MSSILTNILLESEAIDDDTVYNHVLANITGETREFSKKSGIIKFATLKEILIAKQILDEHYSNVEIKPLEEDNNYDLIYHLVYSNLRGAGETQEESFHESVNIRCPKCKSPALSYIEDQGDFSLYNCDNCGDWTFKDKKGNLYKSNDLDWDLDTGYFIKDSLVTEKKKGKTIKKGAFDCGLPLGQGGIKYLKGSGTQANIDAFNHNLGADSAGEAAGDGGGMAIGEDYGDDLYSPIRNNWGDGSDDFIAYSNKMSKSNINKATLEDIENALLRLGYSSVEVGRLLPDPRGVNKANMHFTVYGSPHLDPEEERIKINEILKSYGVSNIVFKSCSIIKNLNCFQAYGFGLIESSPIHEEIENHKELNQDLFKGEELKPEVKDKLLEIAQRFKDNLKENDIELDIKDIQLVGSNAGYNYTDNSDIDLHIMVNLDIYDNEELTQKLYDARRQIWNDKYEPKIYGHEVEVYVEPYEDVDESLDEAISKGAYSLFNGWVSKPTYNEDELEDISDEVAKYIKKAKACKTVEDIDNFLDDLYNLRQSGLLENGEISTGNLIFKELRSEGTIQDLKDKKVELTNKELSLGEALLEDIGNDILNYFDVDPEDIDELGDNIYEINGDSYLICSKEEAKKVAIKEATQLLKQIGFEAFSEEFQTELIQSANPDKIENFIDKEIEYYEENEEDEALVDYLEELKSDIPGCIAYIKEKFGGEFEDWLFDSIDIDSVIERIINDYGPEYFLTNKEGSIKLSDNLYAYKLD